MAKRFTLMHSVMISIMLHVLPFGAYLMPWPATKPPPPRQLNLDLQGLISNVQQVAKAPAAQQQQQPQTEAPAPAAETPKNDDQQPTPPPRPESRPILKEAAPPAKKPVMSTQTPAAAPPPPAPTQIPADDVSVAKTLSNEEKALQFRYVAELVKRLKRQLSFPDDAKTLGLMGRVTTVVTFMVNEKGEIDPASVKIRTSSGFPALDAQAVTTVIAASPVPPPPVAMTVTAPLDFSQRQ